MRQASARNQLSHTKFLSDLEVENLELLLKRRLDSGDERNALLLFIALRSGARAGELLALKKSDFCRSKKTIRLKGSKNSNDRDIPLPDFISNRLDSYIRRLDTDELWPISYPRLFQLWQDYRPAKKKFHSLRHTFALRAYLKTKDIRLVQTALGHRSIINTLIYLDYAHSLSDLKRIIY